MSQKKVSDYVQQQKLGQHLQELSLRILNKGERDIVNQNAFIININI